MQNNHQLRLLYLYQILLRDTDADHPLSTQELLDKMETNYYIKLHRTTIPQYIKLLNASGFEVMEIRSREKQYYLDDRLFELPEIKLLIDAVQASKLITPHKSQQLISKAGGKDAQSDPRPGKQEICPGESQSRGGGTTLYEAERGRQEGGGWH